MIADVLRRLLAVANGDEGVDDVAVIAVKVSTMPAMPRSERGPNTRKPLTVLLSDDEKQEMEKALDEENAERGLDWG